MRRPPPVAGALKKKLGLVTAVFGPHQRLHGGGGRQVPKRVFVALNSHGGSLQAGVEVGESIRSHGFGTFVDAGQSGYSACALAWLGGTALWVTPRSTVGFHQPYNAEGPSVQANAMIGTYVAQLGYGSETTLMVTEASPENMVTLDGETAVAAGLAVQVMR